MYFLSVELGILVTDVYTYVDNQPMGKNVKKSVIVLNLIVISSLDVTILHVCNQIYT